MRFFAVFAVAAVLGAQSLQVTPSTAARKAGTSSFLIKFEPPAGQRISALQWDLSVPADIYIDPHDFAAGSASESAEKSLTCAAGQQAAGMANYRCILYGGLKGLAGGTVAVVKYQTTVHARAGKLAVRVAKAIAVTPDARKIPIPDAQGEIVIR